MPPDPRADANTGILGLDLGAYYFAKQSTTVLMLDDLTTETLDKTVHSVAHGVLRLDELSP